MQTRVAPFAFFYVCPFVVTRLIMNVVPLRLVKDGQRHTARLTTNPVYVDTQLLPPVPLTPPLKIVKRLNGVEHRQPHALLVDGRIAVRVGIPCSVVSGCAYRGVKRGIQVQKRIVVGASAVRPLRRPLRAQAAITATPVRVSPSTPALRVRANPLILPPWEWP